MTPPPELFDMRLRAMRRDRAFRMGPALFLHNRAYNDIIERMAAVKHRFNSALLLGCPDDEWADCVAEMTGNAMVTDPGALFAAQSDGLHVIEDKLDLEPGSFDLIIAIGTLDTVNDLPGALLRLRLLLKPDSLLIGAMSGGDTLPRLRQAMRAADSVMGAAAPHIHPRIEPAALAQLLMSAGFVMPVVDVERIRVSYPSLRKLVSDLRQMGATNVLRQRSQTPLSRSALKAAERDFSSGAEGGRTVETFEILHFAAWSPVEQP